MQNNSKTLLALALGSVSLGAALLWTPTVAHSDNAAVKATSLHWAPPVLDKPITINIGQGYTSKNLKPDRDYIIKLPAEKQVGGIALKGGHNVVLIGGYITVPPGATNQSEQRAIYIKDATGTVHIEGVKIDNSGGSDFDGIAAAAPEATIQLENMRITGLTGSFKTLHADVFQPWGGAKEIRVDHLTGTSDYQGFQINYDRAPIGSADLRNVNLEHTAPPTGRPGFLLWLTTGTKQCNGYPVAFSNFYVEPRKGETVGLSVWPPIEKPNFTSACPAVEKDDAVSWPALPTITGVVKQGPPPQGDFVPEGVAGLDYVSPGYDAN